ncbi:MAG: ABC transporter ATP-binding protein [Candidatus Saccharimonadales bacterium]
MKTPTTTRQTIQIYWQQIRKYPIYFIGLIFSVPLTTLVNQYLPPLILANVLDKLAKGQFIKDQVWASFGTALILYTLLLFIGPFFWRLVDAFNWRLEANVQKDLAERIYKHLVEQSANFHANSFGGSLVSQTNKILGAYVRIVDTTTYNVMPLMWGVIFASIILIPRAPLFVAGFLLVTFMYVLVALKASKPTRELSSKHAATESKQTGYLADSVTNVMAIKSFAGSKHEYQQFSKHTAETKSALFKLMRAMQLLMMYFAGLSRLMQAVALVAAVISVVTFDANIGTVFLVLSFASSISEQLFAFSNNALRNYNRAFGDAAEMTQILQLEPEIKDALKPEKSQIRDGSISFNDVVFTHDGNNDALFDNLSFDIKPGEKIGLVGHSGSGKTTFTRLLLRFSEIDGGEICIDGQNISHITQDDLHSAIAYVPQEPVMFHRSLYENIRYGNFKADEAAIVRAAKVAHADAFIRDLPEGYKTLVGERGVKLSGGQRQRIAIARAMLKNAPILVLDEATSALDSESEVLIQDALWKLMEGRTAIVIAHRLSTIQKMDRIIVLSNGEISEQGTHKELVKNNGTYASLWAHQSGGFLED